MSAFALSNADLVIALASILSTAACGGLRMRMSRFNSLKANSQNENQHEGDVRILDGAKKRKKFQRFRIAGNHKHANKTARIG